MSLVIYLLELLYGVLCRHEWIRERREDGSLGLRCMKCMKRKEHDLARLIAWRPEYTPIEPAHPSDFPSPLQDMHSETG